MIIGPVQFDAPIWLLLIPITWALTIWFARKSLTGMGTVTRRVALITRLIVLTAIISALADPHWRLVSRDVATVMIVDKSRSMPQGIHERLHAYVAEALSHSKRTDRLGAVTTAADALTQSLPEPVEPDVEEVRTKLEGGSAMIGLESATDLASGVRLAMSMIPPDAAGRLTLVSDGNETQGSLLTAARAAAAAGIPIDVLLVDYTYENEVIFDGLYAPATARKGQTINLRMSITALQPTVGEITLMMGDRPVDLSPDDPDSFGQVYELEKGPNTLMLPVPVTRPGAQEFRAFFKPLDPGSDSIAENNNAAGVTFVAAEGTVLLLSDNPLGAAPLVQALEESRIAVDMRNSADAPRSLAELQEFDAVVLMDVPAYSFDFAQQKELASYVRDAGGGLVMIGGENSFGAGGWIGSPVAEVLPLLLEPPEKRNIPKGALALIMHSIEIPNGVYLGKETAKAAVGALSSRDEVGVLEYSWSAGGTGSRWVYPMQEKGDGSAASAAINNMAFGDMPDYGAPMQLAYNALVGVKAGQKHMIMITDGDAQMPPISLIQQYAAAKITITTVCVDPHGGANDAKNMKDLATATGGNSYLIDSRANPGALATLPEIFIKEAQTVKRSLIWEGDPFNPRVVNGAAEPMRGINATLPAMTGYVVTADREGLALTTARTADDDPLVAQWQHGLGRSVAFTSDAATKWSESWVSWGKFKQFWEQHIRWAMRPAGSANLNVSTETRGDNTHVVVTALDSVGDPLNFALFRGTVVDPDLRPQAFELTQTAPGRYEGDFASNRAGTHIITLQYDAVPNEDGEPDRGSAQAAVLRPYPDEYRALEDNTPLLQQVAELTGGRVLPGADPANADLFSRQGLTMPVSLRSIWLAVALASLGLFLADVAIRRVRIDIPAIAAWARGLFRKKAQSGTQVDALRAARQSTRAKLAERAAAGEKRGKDEPAAPTDKSKKFEASPDYLKKPARSVTDAPAPIIDKRKQDAETPQPGGKGGGEQEGGMSRLLAAKKRAQDQMKDEDKKN